MIQRKRSRLMVFLALALGTASLALLWAGCNRPKATGPAVRTGESADEFLEGARDTLRRETDHASCQTAVQQINNHLSRHSDPQLSQELAAAREQRAKLGNYFALTEEEWGEVEGPTFTLLDVQHLEQCFLLRDVARSLDLEGQPPVEQAAAAFAWVVRQMRQEEQPGAPVPPLFALRMGRGTARDRDLVFLALVHQLGIDGCLVALPGPNGGPAGTPRGLAGVVRDKDVYLFDSALGMPLPGPNGQGIATLAQVRSQPGLLRALTVDAAHPYDVTGEQARSASVYAACSLSALAPRMKYLESILGASKVNLAVDAGALLERIGNAAQAQGPEVRPWKQSDGNQNPTCLLRRFLPPGDGGIDKGGGKLREVYRKLVPGNAMPLLRRRFSNEQGKLSEPGERLFQHFNGVFVKFHLEPFGPQELALRGRFDKATEQLVQTRDGLKKALANGPLSDADELRWADEVETAYADLFRARQAGAAGPGENDEAASAAQLRVNEVWKMGTLIVLGHAAEPLGAEATYLLALCKHEQAERAQDRLDRRGKEASANEAEAARGAWKEAESWWGTFAADHSSAPTTAAARTLQARALETLGEPDRARSLLEDLSGNLTSLEKTARLYRARLLKK